MFKWQFHFLWFICSDMHRVKCSIVDLYLIAFTTWFTMGLKLPQRLPHLFNKEVTELFPGKSVREICNFLLYLFYCHSENENVYKEDIHEIPCIGVITPGALNLHIWTVHSDIWLDGAQMCMISLSSLEDRAYYCILFINIEYVSV